MNANPVVTSILQALEPLGLKKVGANQYRSNSPLRSGSDSHSFSVTVDLTADNGAFMDHVSGETGSLYQLAEQLGILLNSNRTPVANSKRPYVSLRDYAEAHGVEEGVFIAAGWKETNYQSRLALSIPTATGLRYRFLDGSKPTYKSESGYKECWYKVEEAVQMANETGQPLLISNGEASTIVAQHQGMAACCVTAGEKKIREPLILQLKEVFSGAIIVAMDCDDTGRRAGQEIEAQLWEHSFDAAYVDLGLGKGGDLGDFCILYGADTSDALIKLAQKRRSSETNREQLVTAPSAVRGPEYHFVSARRDMRPRRKWIVEGILRERDLMVVAGSPKSGKTTAIIRVYAQ